MTTKQTDSEPHFSCAEAAGAPGMPQSRRGVSVRLSGCTEFRIRPGQGREKEYPLHVFPVETQAWLLRTYSALLGKADDQRLPEQEEPEFQYTPEDPRDELDKAVVAVFTIAELLENQRRQEVRPDVIANLLTLIGDRLVEGVEDWGQERIDIKYTHAEQPS